jgi:hypothetical protein
VITTELIIHYKEVGLKERNKLSGGLRARYLKYESGAPDPLSYEAQAQFPMITAGRTAVTDQTPTIQVNKIFRITSLRYNIPQ